MHRALQTSHGVSSDICTSTYDWFFDDEVFAAWRDTRTVWQLHCIGGPGAGKTTLTALIARHLGLHQEARQQPIVTVFVDQDVPDNETAFVEDFLATVYSKLGQGRRIDGDQSDELYTDYELTRHQVREGSRFRERLRLIRDAVHLRSQALRTSRAFLLLDGIDRCGSTLRLMLEDELSALHKAGLSILLTSRLAVFEQNDEARCDHPRHGGASEDDPLLQSDRETLDIYFLCRKCGELLCFSCRRAGRLCHHCGDDINLYEPYDHVNVPISIPEHLMKEYIAWNLESEHGDLGLGSSATKPPLSPLGTSLMSNKVLKPVQKHADDIFEFSYGHIGIAKARLDLLHGMESLDALETRRDQLPANIVTIFDMGINRIEDQTAGQRDLALRALAMAASADGGIAIPGLRALLDGLNATGIRSGEEIIEAARGFLVASTRDDPQKIAVFNQNLVYYIEQRYHKSIHRASLQISISQARFEPQNVLQTPTQVTPYKIARSKTGLQRIPESHDQPFIVRKGTRAWV